MCTIQFTCFLFVFASNHVVEHVARTDQEYRALHRFGGLHNIFASFVNAVDNKRRGVDHL